MKKLLVVLLIVCAASAAFAQDYMTTVKPAFEAFAQDMANVLPFNASVGLGWSDAYVGNFPHFGVGVTVGATTIPFDTVATIVTAFSITLPAELSYVAQFGFPLPAYTVDARIGGFGIPFDIGLKVGYVPPDGMERLGLDLSLDYLLAGGDFRFAILDGKGLKPALSVGVGYSYTTGNLSVPGLLSGPITIGNFQVPDGMGGYTTHTLELTNPALDLAWDTHVLEVKAEISKTLLIFTPHVGVGGLFSFGSHAGGGLSSVLYYDGSPATQADIDAINAAFLAAGETPPDLSTTGFIVEKAAPVGWAGRVFGGLSINLLVVRLDLNAMYSFPGNSYGASANLRVQL
jgi:hypothetical protein